MVGEAHWQWTPDGFLPVATVPLTDRGFRYGLAVFETLRVQAGKACFVDEHVESLARACRDSGFPVEADALEQAADFLAGNPWPTETGVVRVHVTGGDGGPGEAVRECRVFVAFEARQPPTAESLVKGYRLQLHEKPFKPVFGGRKTHNYWPNLLALQEARAAGFDETLLFDAGDQLISASMGNVFVVLADRPGELLTPPAECGARRGIVRSWVMGRGNGCEAIVRRNDLERATEVWITNSWIGIARASHAGAHQMMTVSNQLLNASHCYSEGVHWP